MIRCLFSDTGQLVIVFAACAGTLAGMVTQEITRNRRLDRAYREAAERSRTAETAGRQS